MPLSTANCKPDWYPPEDVAMTPQQALVDRLVNDELPYIIADAVNGFDNLTGGDVLTAKQVFINIDRIHGRAANASDLQLIVNPGFGGLDPASPEQRARRVWIRDYIRGALMRERQKMKQYDPRAIWPSYDIEIIPAGMSGLSVDADDQVTSTWGNSPE